MPPRGDLGPIDPILKVALIFLLTPLCVVGFIACIAHFGRRMGWW